MASLLWSLIILLGLSTYCNGEVCTQNFCATQQCDNEAVQKNCDGEYNPTGGRCGCCGSCTTILKPGDSCPRQFHGGAPPTVKCPDGYYCDSSTLTCQQISN